MSSIIDFAERDYILPETKKPIKLLPHQKRILRDCFTKKGGKFPYQTIVYSCVKKSGKTEIGGLVGMWYSISQEIFNEIYFLANDLEHAEARGFKRISRIVQTNPRASKKFTPKRSIIEIPSTGTEIQALSQDYAGQSGANPGLTIWDELWGYFSRASRRLWTEFTPVPTRLNSLRFIVTYAGYEGESELLWDIYQKGMAGHRLYSDEYLEGLKMPELYKDALRYIWVNDDARLYMYWDNKPRMPWQDAQYYEDQVNSPGLTPNEYKRIHQNEWVSSISSFIPMDVWDACVNPDMSPVMPGLDKPLFLGVDIGIKRDSTAIVGVYWDKEANKMRLALHRIWQPTKTEPVDLERTIEAYILDIHRSFHIASVYYDPSQFVRSAQFLTGQGIPVREYTQVPTNLTKMTQTLFELTRGRNLVMYPSPELRKQNLDAVVKEGAQGMRIIKEKAKQKIDAIVAMAMACQAAWDGAGIVSLPDSQPERPSTWMFEGGGASTVDIEEGEPLSRSKWRI